MAEEVETPVVAESGDTEEPKLTDAENAPNESEHVAGEKALGEHVEGEHVEGEDIEGEHVEGEHVDGEHIEGEHIEGEQAEGENIEGEQIVGEHVVGEGDVPESETTGIEGEQPEGEGLEGEQEEKKEEKPSEVEEAVEEEQAYEEPPPDPSAPFNFSDSKEAMKEPFELRPDQLAEIEQIWEYFQAYTPAYTDLDGYITEKELIYMLKALLIMTYTPEQLQELIEYCVKPPHPDGHITYEQFLKMVTLRQRDFPIDEEIHAAFSVMDPERTGAVDRELLKEVLSKKGHKMPQKHLDNLIKEVDIANDGTIGIDDAVGTMCIDLNKEDMQMLRDAVYGTSKKHEEMDDQ